MDVLVVAGLFEICWAIGLKYTEGFSRPGSTAVVGRDGREFRLSRSSLESIPSALATRCGQTSAPQAQRTQASSSSPNRVDREACSLPLHHPWHHRLKGKAPDRPSARRHTPRVAVPMLSLVTSTPQDSSLLRFPHRTTLTRIIAAFRRMVVDHSVGTAVLLSPRPRVVERSFRIPCARSAMLGWLLLVIVLSAFAVLRHSGNTWRFRANHWAP